MENSREMQTHSKEGSLNLKCHSCSKAAAVGSIHQPQPCVHTKRLIQLWSRPHLKLAALSTYTAIAGMQDVK